MMSAAFPVPMSGSAQTDFDEPSARGHAAEEDLRRPDRRHDADRDVERRREAFP